MLQGRPKLCKSGRSSTMMYAYPFTLCRRAVVITMDMSAAHLDLLRTDHWLSDSKNVLVVRLTAPAWETGGELPQAPAPSNRDAMAAWPVRDVVAFLSGKDLEGPANVFHANGVNGTDLLTMTINVMVQDLRLSSFAARKVASARDTFLQGF